MAQPNAVGWTGYPEGIRIGCDTLQEVTDIFDAGKTSSDAWTAKFMEYHNQLDSLNEPTCMVGDIPVEVTYKAEVDLGEVTLKEGHPEEIWAVEMVTGTSDWWTLEEFPSGTPL